MLEFSKGETLLINWKGIRESDQFQLLFTLCNVNKRETECLLIAYKFDSLTYSLMLITL